MPSNKTLINEAQNLADELGLSVETNGLKNDGLADLVSDLRAKKRDAELETQADYSGDADVTQPDPDPEPEPEPEETGPVVAKGRSVTTKRGILGEGKAISAKDLSGGQNSLDKLVKSGAVEA